MRALKSVILVIVLAVGATGVARGQTSRPQWTDWGGGYFRGPDSASITIATSGAGAIKPAAVAVPPAPAAVPMIDWGGGYLRGPDSASTTAATSGAGTPKANK